MSTLADLYTVSDLESMPDNGNRYEVIEGELFVSTAPSYFHQGIVAFLIHVLMTYLDGSPLGEVVSGPGVIFDDHNGVIPDLVYTSNEQLALILKEGKLRAAPDIVVEVLSPGAANEKRDREIKKRLYSTRGVREYWLVDPEAKSIAVYRARKTGGLALAVTLRTGDDLTTPLLPGFRCPVARVFAR